MIGVLDYGLGNVKAFLNIFEKADIEAQPIKTKENLFNSEKIILPGVGSFDSAIECLTDSGLLNSLNHEVLEEKKPVLGVCVGMQIMANCSEEGNRKGLGWIDGEVKRFNRNIPKKKLYIPHIGWNHLTMSKGEELFHDLSNPLFYFLHSYHFVPNNKKDIISTTNYGYEFVSGIRNGNIWATQFHPEKSHDWGVILLKNFVRACF